MAKQISVLPNYMPIREARSLDNLPPDRHGRWVRNDPTRVRFLVERMGYRIEQVDGKEIAGIKGDYTKGAITSGGDILLTCPKEEFEERKKLRAQITKQRMQGPRETFKTTAAKNGVEVMDKTKQYEGSLMATTGEKDEKD